jgi:hypothetical protein
MANDRLPAKRDVMMALLAKTSVYVHLDSRRPEVSVPPRFRGQPQLVLQIGLNMAVQIRDLDVGDEGFSCTLSFSRQPYFCMIPWTSVFAMVGEDGRALVWPDDVPIEVAASMEAQARARDDKAKAKSRLRAVDSGEAKPSTPPATGAPDTIGDAEGAAPLPAPVPLAAVARDTSEPTENTEGDEGQTKARPQPVTPLGQARQKGKRPSHLRLVK